MVRVIVLMHLISKLVLNELCTIDQDLIFMGRRFFLQKKKKKKKKFFLYRPDGVNFPSGRNCSFILPRTSFFLPFIVSSRQTYTSSFSIFFVAALRCAHQFSKFFFPISSTYGMSPNSQSYLIFFLRKLLLRF
jgi:hypothetical protein